MNKNKPNINTRFIYLSIFFVFIVIINSCGGGGGDNPPPAPPTPQPNVTHTIHYNGNVAAAQALVYDNGAILSSTTTDVDGKGESSFTNKESTTTVDSVVVKKGGYTTFKQVNQAIGTSKTYNFSLEPINTTTHGDLSFKMVDQITKDTILNYAIIKDLDTIAVLKEYIEETILLGEETIFTVMETDSVSRNFSQFDKTYQITNTENIFIEEIESTPREFESQQSILVQTTRENEGDRVDNLTLQIFGQDYEVPQDGKLNFNWALDEDANNLGHPLPENITATLKQTDSSHNLVNEVVKEFTLRGGVQQDTIIGTTIPINRWANYIGAYTDESNNPLEDVNVTAVNKSGVTPADGIIRLDNIIELTQDPLHWWKSVDAQGTISASKNGFTPYSKTHVFQVGDNNFSENMISESAPVADATINLRNSNTSNLIQNIIVQYEGTDLAIDQDFTLSNVAPGNHTLLFQKSDSTYQLFDNFSHTFNLVEGDNNLTLDVAAILKTFEAQYNLDVDDTNNNTLENINVAVDGTNYDLPSNGVVSTITFPLNPNVAQPWVADGKTISVALNPTATSYQFTPEAYTFNLVEGINNDNKNITTDFFNWVANLVVNVDDQDAVDLPGVTLSANSKTAVSDSNGQARIDGVIQLPAGANFWEAGTANVTYDISKDGYDNFAAKTVTVGEGDNVYNETLEETINATYSNATVQVRDVNTNQIIQNILVNYEGSDVAVDDTFELTNVLTDNYAITLKNSDSTWVNFPQFDQSLNLVEGDNTFIFDVDGTTKTFTGTYTQIVNDTQGRPRTNIEASIDGTTYILPENGTTPAITIAIPADVVKPWLAGSKTIPVTIEQSATSYAFDALNFSKVISEGANTDTKTISTTNPFNFVATYNLDVNDTQGETQENMKLTLEGEEIILPANGQLSRTFPLAQQNPNFWLAETKTLNGVIEPTATSFQFTPVTYSINVGDGITNDVRNVTTTPFEWYANLLVNVKDQDAANLAGVTLSANAKTADTDVSGNATINQVIQLPAGANFWESGTANVTYDLVKADYEDFVAKTVTVSEGDNSFNETLDEIVTASTEHGDVAIEPLLNGSPKSNTTIRLTNTHTPDSTYVASISNAQAIFYNIYVSDNNNPSTYEVNIVDNLADGTFLETTTTIQVSQDVNGEINGSKVIDLTDIPNEQDITFTIRDYKTHSTAQGVTLELINNTTSAVVDTQVSDVNGEVIFDNVPGDATYKTRTSKVGDYTKTVGTFSVPHVDLISEMADDYNTTTIPKETYSDGSAVTAEQANKYRLLATNTELVHGRWKKFIDNYANLDNIKSVMNDFVSQIGFPNAITYFTSAFANPTQSQIDNYNAYGSHPFSDPIGTNVTGNGGGNNNPITRSLSNGLSITYNTSNYDLGSGDSGIYHEIAQVAGFEQISQGATIPETCLDPTGPSVLSMYDKTNMSMKYQIAKNHFVETASGKPLEYNYSILTLED